MLTNEANDRLTRVGPGTPMGELLRRYWFPVATSAELDQDPVQAVKILGENLALYRTDEGKLGLVSQRCPHRGASLAYGIPEEEGLRCPYHGWRFDQTGQCNGMPAEPEDSTFKHRIRIPAYPVQELGGLVWGYLGPEPVPLLPRWDTLVREDLDREIGITDLPINFLQAMENSLDPVHLEYLHARYMNYVRKRQGKPATAAEKHHVRIAFDVFKYGITKRRLLEGQAEDVTDWTIGHPILFPTILSLGTAEAPRFEFRIPRDDTHTTVYSLFCSQRAPGAEPRAGVPIYPIPYAHPDGSLVVDTVLGQDMMAWVTQGDISDRSTERLGNSDKGIILYRSVLLDHLRMVERGEDPPGVIRDPAENASLQVHREAGAHYQRTFLAASGEDHLDQVRGKRPVPQSAR